MLYAQFLIWLYHVYGVSSCLVNLIILHVIGLGMHSWEGSSLEPVDFVHNIWNAVPGSKLGGVSLPRKLCKRRRSVN